MCYLQKIGVDISNVRVLPECTTGQAVVVTDCEKGQNQIIIDGGANMKYQNEEDLFAEWKKVIKNGKLLLL